MFGRTGAPTKGAANFLYARNTGHPRVNNESNEQKKVASLSGELTADTRTVMTKKGCHFFRGEGPHIISEQGPAESKSGPARMCNFIDSLSRFIGVVFSNGAMLSVSDKYVSVNECT